MDARITKPMTNSVVLNKIVKDTELISNDIKRPFRGDALVSVMGMVVGALTIASILL
ncbi:hypothetical protein Maeo_1421 [Methanococcus aeolicus Nankai-3]|uniref:Uncharacterized protein n=1 Tax=Methanococcus aeolicus (strain ATCC BAA-1280 / DSM 17508 / OCM 812 / Nankai-3) TaxID=419665 RepID=A6UWX5_META3|nr:hypothetical protein [Methanococcus aeolicus]ABR56997.1 hypothetical protein Maeo_1421 [Methanococcus aeolicus Nankai-3]